MVTQSKIYQLPSQANTKSVVSPMRLMIYLRAMRGGVITGTSVYLSTPMAPLGLSSPPDAEAIFNVRLNGTALFTGANRPKMQTSENFVEKTGLSVAVNKYDAMVLDLESIVGRAGRIVTWMIDIDES